MCDPVSLLVASSVASTGAGIYGQNKANKARKEGERRMREESDTARRNEDAETLATRRASAGSNRDRRQAQASYTPTPFSPRSFFAAL
jgi:hypothetical protein